MFTPDLSSFLACSLASSADSAAAVREIIYYRKKIYSLYSNNSRFHRIIDVLDLLYNIILSCECNQYDCSYEQEF